MSDNEPKQYLPSQAHNAASTGKATEQSQNDTDGDDARTATDDPAPDDAEEQTSNSSGDGTEPPNINVNRLGKDIAKALQIGEFHPVILFGTNFSGKTSVLLSLFSTLLTEPRLNTGLMLCNPILSSLDNVGRELHKEAIHTFEVKTQAFIEGEKIPKTNVPLPYFIPVEMRPLNKPAVKLAFLESNGEWYRPMRSKDSSLISNERLFPALRKEIEDFIANFQGPITFIYLIPYTQSPTYSNADPDKGYENEEIRNASLAISGVLRAYNNVRSNHRVDDRHLMLVTKWDAHSAKAADRASELVEDREDVLAFANSNYAQALAALKGLMLTTDQMNLSAYCAGIIGDSGLLELKKDDDLRKVISGFPIKLWTYLYKNSLRALNVAEDVPFPTPPKPVAIVRWFKVVLEYVSGGR